MKTTVALMLRGLLAVAALSLGACVVHGRSRHPHGGPPGHHPAGPPGHRGHSHAPARSGPDHDHHCHDACDHMWDGAAFVVVVGHRHGHGCGHMLSGNRWVIGRVVVDDGPGHGHGNGRGNGRGRR